MIDELKDLEERVKDQNRTITNQNYLLDKLISNRDKIRGLIADYDSGIATATMLISYLRMYVN